MRPDARPQVRKNRRRIRWNTLRTFQGRERRRWLRIGRRSRTVYVGQAPNSANRVLFMAGLVHRRVSGVVRGWGLIDLPLRATFSPAHPLADIFYPPYPPIASQSISRDVPVSQARASCFLLCTITPSRPGESPDCPSLRASNEHSFIVRVLRARRIVWRLPSHPSEAARCASTGDQQTPSPPLLREQETSMGVVPRPNSLVPQSAKSPRTT